MNPYDPVITLVWLANTDVNQAVEGYLAKILLELLKADFL